MTKSGIKQTLNSLLLAGGLLAGAAGNLSAQDNYLEDRVSNAPGPTRLKVVMYAKAEEYKLVRRELSKKESRAVEKRLLARMLLGEARNCSDLEKVAIAYTVINRVKDGKNWNGTNIKDVILKDRQYSCFNYDDRNRKVVENPEKYPEYKRCYQIASAVLDGKFKDPTNGATHYYNPKVTNPSWKNDMVRIGKLKTNKGPSRHEFYQEL